MADTTITPASPLTWPANLAVPTPGDGVKAATAPGAVRPGYQALLNGVASAQARTYGRPKDILVECESNTSLIIYPVGSFTILDAGVWKTYSNVSNLSFATGGSVVTVNPDALTGGLVANTRYWVYLKKPTGADPFDVIILAQSGATNTPDRNMAYLTADQSATLISSFWTDHAGDILTYRQIGGRFMFKTRTATGGGARGNLMLDLGSAVAATAVNFGDAPIVFGTRMLGYEAECARAGTAFVGQIMLNATQPSIIFGGDGVAQVVVRHQGHAYGNGATIYYQVDNAATTMSIWCTEFQIW